MYRERKSGENSSFIAISILMVLLAAVRCSEYDTKNNRFPKEQREPPKEKLVREIRSDFSHIRIKDFGSMRTLCFVRDSGLEVVETAIDLRTPYKLQIPNLQYMFISFLLNSRQESCLIVGLGGGAMIHFLNHFFPDMEVDAVEIDPVVVKLADEYFGTRPGSKTRIFTEDAFDYLRKTKGKYDVIYMDAFLKPGEETDSTGFPLRLKTIAVYRNLQEKLKEKGQVVFNLNPHPNIADDIDAIRQAFPQVYVFIVPGNNSLVAIGSTSRNRLCRPYFERAGRAMDQKCDYGFSFESLAKNLWEEEKK